MPTKNEDTTTYLNHLLKIYLTLQNPKITKVATIFIGDD